MRTCDEKMLPHLLQINLKGEVLTLYANWYIYTSTKIKEHMLVLALPLSLIKISFCSDKIGMICSNCLTKKAKKMGRHGGSLYVSEKRGFHNGDKKATNVPVGAK